MQMSRDNYFWSKTLWTVRKLLKMLHELQPVFSSTFDFSN